MKDQTLQVMILLIRKLRDSESIIVKKIQCNNSGENVTFQAMAKQEGLGLHFKFMAHQTLQQNGQVECKFATLLRRVRPMLNLARLTGKYEDFDRACGRNALRWQ